MLKRLLCILLSFSLVVNYASAQSANIQAITQKLEKFRKAFPQEKIHLHFDKTLYSIGDTIYFKAYVVNAEKNLPSAISNIIYVDLIDENNNIQRTVRRPVTDGVAWGTIELADTLPEGNYRIRSYTNWMRNFDDTYFSDQFIAVGNALSNDIITNTVFKVNSSANKSIDTAVIHYKSLRRFSLAGKEVNYSIIVNKKVVQKGKGKTDGEGKLHIDFAAVHPQKDYSAELITYIRPDDKTTVTRVIKLELPVAQRTIQFFPEGGQMIIGLPTRVGFKAVGSDGLGTNVSGEVTDETSSNPVTFKTGFAGMGSFQFTPQAGHSYHAHLRYEDGTEENKDLPKAEEYGYALSIDNTDSQQVRINIAAKLVTPSENVTVVAQYNNRIQYSATLSLNNGNASTTVSKKKFPAGIVQFTLFDAATKPVAERLAFINQNDCIRINKSLDKVLYSKREHVKMMLTVKDEKGDPVAGNFSIAVTDGSSAAVDTMNKRSILSDLLLTSDLKGYIEKPDYYFTDINNNKIIELDNLLLTQGWRRFAWEEILANKFPAAMFAVEKNLAISGKVLSMKGEPVAGAKVTLLSKKGQGYIYDTLTGTDGSFTFEDLDFDDDKPFVIQAKAADNLKVQVKQNDFSPPLVSANESLPSAKPISADLLEPYLAQSVQRFDNMRKNGLMQNAHVLKAVTVTGKQLTKVQEAVAPSYNLNGPGNADQILTYLDLKNCHDLGQCLQGKLTGVIFKMVMDDEDRKNKSRNPSWHLQAFSAIGMGKPMLIVLDGTDLSGSAFDIRNIPAENIQSIEVLRSGAYVSSYGTRASGGVLVITTKKGDIDYDADLHSELEKKRKENNFVFINAKGYTPYRKFYSPDYSNPSGSNTMPDLRSTIYWQPNVLIQEDGKAEISFYNTDIAAKCNVVIEGLSENGKPGRVFFTYEVR
jgi:hypothetical protein